MDNEKWLREQLESSLVPEDDDTKHKLNGVHCVIRAIYQLSFNHYLKRNGFKLSNLNEQNEMAEYRRLQTWPSQSRFVFSLKQMRDAYARLAKHPLAPQFMNEHEREQAHKKTKSKEEFWTILGEAPTADESFHILEHDPKTTKKELQRLRLLAHVFRLVLFQNKITQYQQTGNFLALLKSTNRRQAREAFRDCTALLPFPHDFFEGSESGSEGEQEFGVEDATQADECRKTLLNLVENVETTLQNLAETKRQCETIGKMLRDIIKRQRDFCGEFTLLLPQSRETAEDEEIVPTPKAADALQEQDFFHKEEQVQQDDDYATLRPKSIAPKQTQSMQTRLEFI